MIGQNSVNLAEICCIVSYKPQPELINWKNECQFALAGINKLKKCSDPGMLWIIKTSATWIRWNRKGGGINSKPYWSLLAGPHIKGFNKASASKQGKPHGILIMTTVYFKYKCPREAFFYVGKPLCVSSLLLGWWEEGGGDRRWCFKCDFCWKLLPLFWFLSHDPSIELNVYRSGPPVTISSANSSSPRCSAVRGGWGTSVASCCACLLYGTQKHGAGRRSISSAPICDSVIITPSPCLNLSLSEFRIWEGLGRGQWRREGFIKSRG